MFALQRTEPIRCARKQGRAREIACDLSTRNLLIDSSVSRSRTAQMYCGARNNKDREYVETHLQPKGTVMGRSLLLWMIGVPIPIIILVAIFMR